MLQLNFSIDVLKLGVVFLCRIKKMNNHPSFFFSGTYGLTAILIKFQWKNRPLTRGKHGNKNKLVGRF